MNTTPFYLVEIDPTTRIVLVIYDTPFDRAPDNKGANFVSLSPEQYQKIKALPGAKIAEDGSISSYTPPPPPLKPQAQAAMQAVQQQAAMVTAMGETFGPQTRAYVKALRAIINGSDTTSAALPTAPSDVTM